MVGNTGGALENKSLVSPRGQRRESVLGTTRTRGLLAQLKRLICARTVQLTRRPRALEVTSDTWIPALLVSGSSFVLSCCLQLCLFHSVVSLFLKMLASELKCKGCSLLKSAGALSVHRALLEGAR